MKLEYKYFEVRECLNIGKLPSPEKKSNINATYVLRLGSLKYILIILSLFQFYHKSACCIKHYLKLVSVINAVVY